MPCLIAKIIAKGYINYKSTYFKYFGTLAIQESFSKILEKTFMTFDKWDPSFLRLDQKFSDVMTMRSL